MAACEPFQPWHLEKMAPQSEQLPEVELLRNITPDQWSKITRQGLTFSAIDGDRIIFCCGLIPKWHGRAQGWTVFADNITRREMLFIHRMSKILLEQWQSSEEFRRIETTVRAEFDAGHRWAKMLGFHPEGLMSLYDPLGRAYVLYSRICSWPLLQS